jgi:hypothetical protein
VLLAALWLGCYFHAGKWLALGLVWTGLCVVAGLVLRQLIGRPMQRLCQQAESLPWGGRSALQRGTRTTIDELSAIEQQLVTMADVLHSRLSSSTELNLHLESEVARRGAEQLRRKAELEQTLQQLERARDGLLRSEKLATVGLVASKISEQITGPVEQLARQTALLEQLFGQLAEQGPVVTGAATLDGEVALVVSLQQTVKDIVTQAGRTRDLVRAMRVYARTTDEPRQEGHAIDRCELLTLLAEVLRLFAAPVQVQLVSASEHAASSGRSQPTESAADALAALRQHTGPLWVLASLRSDLALLLASSLLYGTEAASFPAIRAGSSPKLLPRLLLGVTASHVELLLDAGGHHLLAAGLEARLSSGLRERLLAHGVVLCFGPESAPVASQRVGVALDTAASSMPTALAAAPLVSVMVPLWSASKTHGQQSGTGLDADN